MATKSSNSIILITVVAALALAFGVYFQGASESGNEPGSVPDGAKLGLQKMILLPNPRPVQGVDFADHLGNSFGSAQLAGYWTLMFFGFTHCPDICPTTMATLAQVKQQLQAQDKWGNYRVIMTSVDPARDTPDKLASYVPFFDPEFIGLTGDVTITEEFAKQLGILFIAREAKADGRYDVDHGAAIIVLNPAGEMAGVISAPHRRDEIAADLIKLADYYSDDHTIPITNNDSTSTSTAQKMPAADTGSKAAQLSFSERWIRPAPPGVSAMAGYLTITNNGSNAVRITDAGAAEFDEVMIHATVEQDAMTGMQHMDGLTIDAGATVELRPLGMHLMLIEPEQELTSGAEVTVTLTSATGDNYAVILPVRTDPRQGD